ncbi:hypothetical protein ABZY03_33810, partial [Streptomyces klenkii]|uniref:hypothetical protein n=1 Tax=Streptomyces klenkii TaxID=1420899 RepID=UPI00339F6011
TASKERELKASFQAAYEAASSGGKVEANAKRKEIRQRAETSISTRGGEEEEVKKAMVSGNQSPFFKPTAASSEKEIEDVISSLVPISYELYDIKTGRSVSVSVEGKVSDSCTYVPGKYRLTVDKITIINGGDDAGGDIYGQVEITGDQPIKLMDKDTNHSTYVSNDKPVPNPPLGTGAVEKEFKKPSENNNKSSAPFLIYTHLRDADDGFLRGKDDELGEQSMAVFPKVEDFADRAKVTHRYEVQGYEGKFKVEYSIERIPGGAGSGADAGSGVPICVKPPFCHWGASFPVI